jgi:hypothetical protein
MEGFQQKPSWLKYSQSHLKNGEKLSVLTYVKRIKTRHLFGLFFLLATLFWYVATPVVNIYYSENGKEELRYVWITPNATYKERMLPGQSTFDTGDIFPNEKFFMMFDWWSEGGIRNCIYITPKWPRTKIYLDGNGDIDTQKTAIEDMSRVKPCR